MQLPSHIFSESKVNKELSFTSLRSKKKKQKLSTFFPKKYSNKNTSDFVNYQKEQYKKFFVSRKSYTDTVNTSQIFKFNKINHILFLVFFTYFFGLRFISSYD